PCSSRTMISVRMSVQRRPALKQIKRAVPSGSLVPRWWLSHGEMIHARIAIGEGRCRPDRSDLRAGGLPYGFIPITFVLVNRNGRRHRRSDAGRRHGSHLFSACDGHNAMLPLPARADIARWSRGHALRDKTELAQGGHEVVVEVVDDDLAVAHLH